MMSIRVNRIFCLLILAAVTGLAACGDAMDDAEGTAPTISNLSLAPTSVPVGESSQIRADLDFEDPDGDASQMAVSVTTPAGQSQSLGSIELQNASGNTGSGLQLTLFLNPPEAGDYEFFLVLSDEAGNDSNELTGSVAATN